MMDLLSQAMDFAYKLVWMPLPLLILGIGIYFTFCLRGIQFTKLRLALQLVLGKEKQQAKGDITHFQSLMTALAATLGIGNIAGVATALTVGGLGAIFWMWITAIVGMTIKYAEALLAVKYRVEDGRGEMCGGPMYFIQRGLGWKTLAGSFALFGSIAAFGGGNMLQANSVADVMKSAINIDPLYSGIIMALLAALTLMGGIKSISKVASVLVPMMGMIYIGGALFILVTQAPAVPGVILAIFKAAFNFDAVVGGAAGTAIIAAIQVGASRGLMTSEAGLGTASIAAAAAKTDTLCRQALVSMTGAFLATLIMCTITVLVIGVSGLLGSVDSQGKLVTGATLTLNAFSSMLPGGAAVVSVSLVLFAFTTLIGWAYYGEKCMEYLLGEKSVRWYRIFFILAIIPGAVLELELVWKLSDITNGLMAFPNLIGLVALFSVVMDETKEFLAQPEEASQDTGLAVPLPE